MVQQQKQPSQNGIRKNHPPEGIQSMTYSTGGVVDYTGPAWVHGSKNKPETFLNADQTKLFAHLRDMLERRKFNNVRWL